MNDGTRVDTSPSDTWAEVSPSRTAPRECPKCRQGGAKRRVLMEPEIGSWSGELLWRCELHGAFYERDLA